jgi:hypothetical protein
MDKNDIHNVKLTSTSLFLQIKFTDLLSMYIMMCINFPMTVSMLQNNERCFLVIFTITVVEFMSISAEFYKIQLKCVK